MTMDEEERKENSMCAELVKKLNGSACLNGLETRTNGSPCRCRHFSNSIAKHFQPD